ncbi:type II secretion system protein [Noviherbaspirillum pedocola]|uniref:Prepilin-type N-terminal cleavage/methylation domain-containing protein n=1 Tax=Noviherbaspirillum pedocola TaxID=2801341 RepID=A0A934T021_9BURK|nr:prepilin-type N-terminal cleavage/methylation domain-containing protein [Noviherbaspirillum pedocola]MBK4735929.1 prepilin-type N-terminal cleavage/methylation domain-containing protein [Noviherbaspirillum pedocola]
MKSARRIHPQGFTMIELAVVTAVIGILLCVVAPSIRNNENAGRAAQIERIAQSAVGNWATLTQQTGLPTTVNNSPIAATPSATGVTEVLFIGASKVASSFQPAYSASSVQAMTQIVDNPSGSTFRTAGSVNTTITMDGGGGSPVTVTFQNVSNLIAQAIINHTSADASLTVDGNSYTVGPWTYTCASATLTCTLTYSRQL